MVNYSTVSDALSQLDARSLLAHYGLRYSRPREAILAYFREADKHVNAEAIHSDLKERGNDLSLSTVYLNLGVLKEVGLVREFHGVGGESLYDSNVSRHYHLICKQCGKVVDLPEEVTVGETPRAFRQRAQAASGWQVEEPDLNLYGTCPECQT